MKSPTPPPDTGKLPADSTELESGFSVGSWRVEPLKNVISRQDEVKHLENRLMRTLVFLAAHPHQVIKREQFFDSVWQGRVVNEEALSRAISLLRTALEDDALTPKFIQTVPGVGYRLIAPVTLQRDAVAASPHGPRENSIAVLPFVNLSEDPNNEYFSDGISEEILNSLAQVESFLVVGRTSSFAFKGRNEDLREIGRTLNVSHVLEGSVRKAGQRVRVTAQLIKVQDGFHVWSETFDRALEDIFAVQDEIAAAVVGALKARLLGTMGRSQHTDTEVYSLYLQALYFVRSGVPNSVQKALDLFTQVTGADPEYAPGWVGLAEAIWYLISYGALRRDEGIDRAAAANDRALALDDRLVDAHVMKAILSQVFGRDWATAQDSLKTARRIAPDNARVLLHSGNLASNLGDVAESVTFLRRAIALDPLNTTGHIWLSLSLIALDELEEAKQTLRQALELNPQRSVAHMIIGKACILQGEMDAAHREMLLEPEGFWRDFGLTQSLYALERYEEADEAFRQLIDTYAHEAPFQIGEIHAVRGEFDDAFRWLERARDERDNGLTELYISPATRALHGDERWPALLHGLGLRWPLEHSQR